MCRVASATSRTTTSTKAAATLRAARRDGLHPAHAPPATEHRPDTMGMPPIRALPPDDQASTATAWRVLDVLGRQVGDSRLVGGSPPSAVWRR